MKFVVERLLIQSLVIEAENFEALEAWMDEDESLDALREELCALGAETEDELRLHAYPARPGSPTPEVEMYPADLRLIGDRLVPAESEDT